MDRIPGSSLKAHQYTIPEQPVSVPNLKLAIKLTRLGYSQDYISEFVSGPWSPELAQQHPMEATCPELTLPSKKTT
ncbi:hypothetical protein [Rufibacter roseus]|uniref:Uncharacterized protein n=1 Tax=Rufibacter roseus TaxID=1567108 RepID=A0ABW2DSI7_9BACT|nr:hypothetical protein [Rufibacter roseus]